MLGWRSLNSELIPLDPELERTLRRKQRALVEIGDNIAKNSYQLENVRQPKGENDLPRAENEDYTRSLRGLFALVATNSPSCIVLPPTNATHFDLKPHVI
jgi:hypothetical protein